MKSEMELLRLGKDTLEIEITIEKNNTMHVVHNGKYGLNIIYHVLYMHINMQVRHFFFIAIAYNK